MGNVWYVLSISLQMSGALLLIFEWCRKTETLLIEKYFMTNAVSLAKNDNGEIKIQVNVDNIKTVLRNIYINRSAFMYIFSGYVLSVWGRIGEEKIVIAVCIALLTAIITWVSDYVINKKAESESKLEYYKMVIEADVPDGIVAVVPRK